MMLLIDVLGALKAVFSHCPRLLRLYRDIFMKLRRYGFVYWGIRMTIYVTFAFLSFKFDSPISTITWF